MYPTDKYLWKISVLFYLIVFDKKINSNTLKDYRFTNRECLRLRIKNTG